MVLVSTQAVLMFNANATKLFGVNEPVPTIGVAVTLYARRNVFMTNHSWVGHAFCCSGSCKCGAATNVVGMAVRVNEMAHWC